MLHSHDRTSAIWLTFMSSGKFLFPLELNYISLSVVLLFLLLKLNKIKYSLGCAKDNFR